MAKDKIKIYRDEGGEWRWTRQAANGEKVSNSGEGYVDLSHALSMAKSRNPGVEVNIEPTDPSG